MAKVEGWRFQKEVLRIRLISIDLCAVMRLQWILLFAMAVVGGGCNRDRCITAEGPRLAKETLLPDISSISLNMVADLSIDIDTLQVVKAEVIAQKDVHPLVKLTPLSDMLDVRLDGCVKRHDPILIHAVCHRLSYVESASAGSVRSSSIVRSPFLHLKTKGLGEIDFVVDADEIVSEIQSSGDISLAGACKKLEFLTTSSGDLRAFNLVSDTVLLHMAGSGIAEVYAYGQLHIRFYEGGKVTYRGRPSEIVVEGEGEVVDGNSVDF